jgi:PEGA domain
MTVPRSPLPAIFVALGLVLVGGCATASRTRAPVPATPAATPFRPAETAPASLRPAAPGAAPAPAASAVAPAPGAPAPADASATVLDLLVETDPPGAIIIVDGVPAGRAPLHLKVAATALGFFRDYEDIRARFVAEDPRELTRTSVEEFTPREKVPASVRFTPDGAQRTMR